MGEKIRLAREKKGWSQEQLANALGVEPPTISRWETGSNDPRPRHWPLIVKALEHSREWFDGEESGRLEQIEARLKSLENISPINEVPDELVSAWKGAEKEEWRRGLALFFLTGDRDHLKKVRPEIRQRLEKVLDFHSMHPSEKVRVPKR